MPPGHALPFAFGTEDFAFDRLGTRLLVSAQERRSSEEVAGHRPPGALWAVPITPAGPGTPYPLNLERPTTGDPFHPVGISLFQDGGGQLLFVINRADKPRLRAIEVFEIHGDTLRLARPPLRSDFLRNPYGILAVSRHELYLSNDAHARRPFALAVERLLRRSRGSVVHYDDATGRWQTVAGSIGFPNGLALSADGKRLFVAATMEKKVRVYPRSPDRRLGPELPSIDLPAHPDNLQWEGDGRLNVACATSLWALLGHRRSPTRLSPSEVYRIDVGPEPARPERLFADDGRKISGSSTALVIGKRLYISQLMGNGIYVAELP